MIGSTAAFHVGLQALLQHPLQPVVCHPFEHASHQGNSAAEADGPGHVGSLPDGVQGNDTIVEYKRGTPGHAIANAVQWFYARYGLRDRKYRPTA